ncbi:MAG: ATP-binding protein [Ramlibacter sp.]
MSDAESAPAANAPTMLGAGVQHFFALFDQSPHGVVLLGLDLRVLRANPAFAAMVGHDEAALLDKSGPELTHPDDARDMACEVAAMLAGKLAVCEHTRRYLHKDGGVVWARTRCTLVRDASQRPLHFIHHVDDLGASLAREGLRASAELEARLEARVEARTAQLAAANRELESISHSVAHDLRAPLGSIDGFSRLLAQAAGDALPQRAGHYIERIRAGVRQMGVLTDGLLSLASYARVDLQWETVDLAALVRRSLSRCRLEAPSREVREIVAEPWHARGDVRLLSQMIDNLVRNAWRFTEGRDHACIEAGSQRQADGTLVHFVRDNGVGFDMAQAAHLFDAFHGVHSGDETKVGPARHDAAPGKGTGIGLAAVQRIVARHGGHVWAEGAPGAGATLWFTLGDAPL